jgi:hypothetical protein
MSVTVLGTQYKGAPPANQGVYNDESNIKAGQETDNNRANTIAGGDNRSGLGGGDTDVHDEGTKATTAKPNKSGWNG